MDLNNIDPAKWADAILYLILGILSIFGIGQVRKQKTAAAPSEMIEVAGAIVSDKAVDRMVKSMDALSASNTMLTHAINTDVEAKKALTQAMAENSRALHRNSDVSEEMHEEIRDTGNRIDQLKTELVRGSR